MLCYAIMKRILQKETTFFFSRYKTLFPSAPHHGILVLQIVWSLLRADLSLSLCQTFTYFLLRPLLFFYIFIKSLFAGPKILWLESRGSLVYSNVERSED